MPSTLAKADLSMRLNSIDRRMTKAAIAGPVESSAVHDSPSLWTEAIREGLMDACESLKVAAITMEMDPSQLSRDLASGAFQLKRLEKLSGEQKALVVRRLTAVFLELMDPDDYALRAIDTIESQAKELRQYVAERKRA